MTVVSTFNNLWKQHLPNTFRKKSFTSYRQIIANSSNMIAFRWKTILLAAQRSYWGWLTGAISLLGYAMTWIGARLKPKRARFDGIETVADLVRRINVSMS
jgi:hypothetical protein